MSALESTGLNRSFNESGPISPKRNTRMDFDDLKRAWHDCDHNLDASINLNSRRLRSVLRLNAEVSTNRSTPGDVDYTMPVVVAQRQSHAHWFARIGRGVA